MSEYSSTSWMISITTLFVFILTFFILFRDTHEIFSSLTAAILSSILVFGSLIVLNWFKQIFKK